MILEGCSISLIVATNLLIRFLIFFHNTAEDIDNLSRYYISY